MPDTETLQLNGPQNGQNPLNSMTQNPFAQFYTVLPKDRLRPQNR